MSTEKQSAAETVMLGFLRDMVPSEAFRSPRLAQREVIFPGNKYSMPISASSIVTGLNDRLSGDDIRDLIRVPKIRVPSVPPTGDGVDPGPNTNQPPIGGGPGDIDGGPGGGCCGGGGPPPGDGGGGDPGGGEPGCCNDPEAGPGESLQMVGVGGFFAPRYQCSTSSFLNFACCSTGLGIEGPDVVVTLCGCYKITGFNDGVQYCNNTCCWAVTEDDVTTYSTSIAENIFIPECGSVCEE